MSKGRGKGREWLYGTKRQIEKNPAKLEVGASSTDKEVGSEGTKEF